MNTTRGKEIVERSFIKFSAIISLDGLKRKLKLSLNTMLEGVEDGENLGLTTERKRP